MYSLIAAILNILYLCPCGFSPICSSCALQLSLYTKNSHANNTCTRCIIYLGIGLQPYDWLQATGNKLWNESYMYTLRLYAHAHTHTHAHTHIHTHTNTHTHTHLHTHMHTHTHVHRYIHTHTHTHTHTHMHAWNVKYLETSPRDCITNMWNCLLKGQRYNSFLTHAACVHTYVHVH